MVIEQNEADNGEMLDGDRGITSVASGTGKSGNLELSKKVGIAAGIVFLGLLAWLQWPAGEEQVAEEVTESTRRIRVGGPFQPAEIGEPRPEEVAATDTPVASEQPVGPIERIRIEQNQQPSEPTEAELLFESSKRAPLMAYEGSGGVGPAADADGGGGRGLFGQSGGGSGQETAGLADDLQTTAISGSMASVLENPHLTITQGTSIPCALDTAMDSSQPGMVRCTVTDNIYSTMGTVVLLEKGSKIVGQYRGGLQRGTRRLFVIWTRAETPNGVIVTLDSAGTDALGRGGFSGDVDTQFWTRFGGTMLLSIIDDALAAAVVNSSNAEKLENTSNAASDVASVALQSSIDVPIVLRKNQGESVAVMVARDLDFSSVYRLSPR